MTYFEPSLRRKRIVPKKLNWTKIALYSAALAIALHFVVEPHLVVAKQEDYRLLEATVTAYTSSEDETDENPHENASGGVPGIGSLACPSKYTFGTRVVIDEKEYVCDDRMNKRFRKTERFDIWMPSKEAARKWGKREMTVAIYPGS